MKWELVNTSPQSGELRWVVIPLDDEQEPIRNATERWSTKKQAMAAAKRVNSNGAPVLVLCEHAYCIAE